MGLGTYLSDRIFGQDKESQRDERLKREELWLRYYPDLSKQYNARELASMQRRYVEGEGLHFPSMRSRTIPRDSGMDVMEKSILEPIELNQEETVLVNPYTGTQTTIRGKKVKTYGADNSDVDVVVADSDTGTMKKIGTTKKGSKIVNKPKQGGSPKTMKEFQDQAALGVLKNYFTLEATGQDLENVRPSAISAAKRFGMTIEQAKEDPNLIQRLFGQEGETVEKPSFTQPGIRSNNVPRGTKKLTKEIAAQFLQEANGDKEMARKLAREAGYTF